METRAKIALGGGGGAQDSRLLDELFASWLGPQGRLLYWPVALRGIRTFQSCREWITATFAPWQVTRITMWADLSQHQAAELDQFDGVYIGGGNTYSLLAELLETGFDDALAAYVAEGKPVYGGSAGAVVLGRDIGTVSHLDRNDVGLTRTKGMDLVNDYAIWVHYRPEEDRLIEAYIQQHRQPVLALSERSGVAIEVGEMRTVGFEPVYRFDAQGKFEI